MLYEEGNHFVWEQQMMQFVFNPGCHSFPPRLPEQHGVRLETEELYRGHPWGKHTLAGIRPPGVLRPVTDNLIVIIAPVGMRDVAWLQHIAGLISCWSAINTKLILDQQAGWRRSMKTTTLMFSPHLSRTAVRSSFLGLQRLHFNEHMISKSPSMVNVVVSHILILQIFFRTHSE